MQKQSNIRQRIICLLKTSDIELLFLEAKGKFQELDDKTVRLHTRTWCIPSVHHREKWKLAKVLLLIWDSIVLVFTSMFFYSVFFQGIIFFIAPAIIFLFMLIPSLIMSYDDLRRKEDGYIITFPKFFCLQGKSPLFVMCHEFAHILLEENIRVSIQLKPSERSANLIAWDRTKNE